MEESSEFHYEPSGTPDRLATRAKIPRQPLGLNKRAILLLAVGVALVIGFVVLSAFSPKHQEEQATKRETHWSPYPSEAVQGLPNDYHEKEKKREVRERQKPVKQQQVSANKRDEKRKTQAEKILDEFKVTQLKDAIKARQADLEFKGVASELITPHSTKRASYRSPNQATSALSGGDMASLAAATSAPPTFNPRDDENRQDEKQQFLSADPGGTTHVGGRLRAAASHYELLAGSVIPGLMVTGINSDLPGQILGQISQNIFDSVHGRHLLIPQGTKVIGMYDSKVTYGQQRVLIVWQRLLFPNGKSLSLEGMPGVDMSGYGGLKDSVNNHYVRLVSGVVFGSLLGASAQVAYGSYQNVNPDFGQLALQGGAQNLNQVGQKITQKNLNIQPTLEIRPGLRFNIFVTKDITLEPYER